MRWPWLLACLSDLAPHLLTGVADAFALVGLGLAELADVGSDLAHQLLVDAGDAEPRRPVDRGRDAVGRLEHDRVRVAELELQLRRAPGQHSVADAVDLELLLVAIG